MTWGKAIKYNCGSTEEHVTNLEGLADEQFCYLTTTGRNTGRPHTVEIWYGSAPGGATLYILSGGGDRSDWVKNILRSPEVDVRIGDRTFRARGRIVSGEEEDLLARKLVVGKYYGREKLNTTGWEAEALPVALDLAV